LFACKGRSVKKYLALSERANQLAWSKLQPFRHLYLICVLAWYLAYGWKSFLTVDVLFLLFLPAAFIYRKGLEYIKRFLPFVILVLTYDSLRGLVPLFVHNIHFHEMIAFDKWMSFGHIPTVTLQHILYQGQLHWYDYYLYFTYMLHFIAPCAIAFLIWKYRPSGYWRYIAALLILSYAGFVTYLLFPAAPPWMASELGYIPPITKISTAVWWGWGLHDIPNLYAHLNPNQTAAVPSLHAAYPMLELLMIHRLFGRRWSLAFLIYPLSVWFGVVYLGEHYIIDVLIGMLYAAVAFYFVEWAYARIQLRRRTKRKEPATAPVLT
jgi:hypothetical protein